LPPAPPPAPGPAETRVIERVVREVPVPEPAARAPRGPLTAEAVSKIGKLPERRRAHTLFGQRRR
ncbi:hypothetical protein, partial [Oceanicella sp. SM1341]|uniref:hypothetical protein n=1 Tax=Oceanicella sp. SM1341 TaxID=1548889 RepID=UPI0018E4E79E